jgi:hypothetical protein
MHYPQAAGRARRPAVLLLQIGAGAATGARRREIPDIALVLRTERLS